MGDWQPIDTFQGSDGEPVLVWDSSERTVAHRTNGRWFVHDTYGFCEDGEIYDMSHWMDLPDPPKACGEFAK